MLSCFNHPPRQIIFILVSSRSQLQFKCWTGTGTRHVLLTRQGALFLGQIIGKSQSAAISIFLHKTWCLPAVRYFE